MVFDLMPILGKMNILSSEYSSIVSMNLFVALLCACIVIGHLLEENRWMNESITALVIGLCTGFVILLTSGGKSSHLLVFSEDMFFIYLLPPIIFNAGEEISTISPGLLLPRRLERKAARLIFVKGCIQQEGCKRRRMLPDGYEEMDRDQRKDQNDSLVAALHKIKC